MYNLLYETTPWHKRAALFDNEGRLILLKYYEDSRRYIEGVVVLGRVRKIAKGLNAAFVDIGDVVDGFLPLKTVPKSEKRLTEGSPVIVRIARSGVEGKGARLDARVADKMPTGDVKIPSILRAARSPLQRILEEAGDTPIHFWVTNDTSYAEVEKTVPEARERIHFLTDQSPQPLTEILEEQLDTILAGQFSLPEGGAITIEETAALTAIDIDSGAFFGIGAEEGVVTFNLMAVHELARLIRLLDIGGNIIADFITMKHKRDRQKITRELENQFSKTDFKTTEIFAMSRFGLVEMNREKTGPSRIAQLQNPAFIAGRILLQLARPNCPYKQAIQLKVAPEIAEILAPRLTEDICQKIYGQRVHIQPEVMPLSRWQLST